MITRSATTRVAVTLAEKQTLTTPYWLWRFVNDASNIEHLHIIAEVANPYIDRYNLFEIREGLPSAIILPEGIYTYYVYEQTNNSNLSYENTTTLCEVGQMKVVGTSDQEYSNPTYTVEYAWTTQ